VAFDGGGQLKDVRQRGAMKNLRRLERFWHSLVSEQKLTLGTEVDGAVIACWPDIPSFRLNHAADIEVTKERFDSLLRAVTDYFLSKGVPTFSFRVSPLTRPKSFVNLLNDHGFGMQDEDSVMVFRGELPGEGRDNAVDIREIEEGDIDVFSRVSVMAYEMPSEWKEGFDTLFRHRMRAGGRHYLAHVDGVPVGTCALISSMKTGGIFSVGTLERYRRKGVGTAMTLRAVRDSIDEGNTLHTLQAEKGGYAEQIYRKMGFETDCTIAYFAKTVKG
jgi:GNAT superfamily N-acetyltransferase